MDLIDIAGNTKIRVSGLVVIAIVALFIVSFNVSITGFAVYSKTTVENNSADGEGTIFSHGLPLGTDYTNTKIVSTDPEYINENMTTYELKWSYFFNTVYNESEPANIEVIANVESPSTENFNISIYNFNNNTWIFLNETSSSVEENSTSILSWTDRNLTHYVNQTDGKMYLLFEDKKQSVSDSWVKIDYLAINVTVSPFRADWHNLTYPNGSAVGLDGLNYTRVGGLLNVSAHWNASSVSVADGYVLINDSNMGNYQEINLSAIGAGFGNFSGNYTNYTMNFSNVTQFKLGGNYTIGFRAWDSFWQQNTTTAAGMVSWFYLWSNATVNQIATNATDNSTLGNRSVKLLCGVVDSFSSEPVNGYNVSFYNSSGLIGWGLTNTSGWAITSYTETNTTGANYTIICNITNQPGIYYNASTNDNQSMVLQVIEDPYPPVVNSVVFRYRNVTTNKTNLYTNLSIIANVTDNTTSPVSVTATVAYPGGESVTGTMNQNQSSTDLWFIFFNTTNADMPVNSTGNYGVNITTQDLNSNVNWSDWTNDLAMGLNFTAYASYNVTLDNYVDNTAIYNRGEGLRLLAIGVNGLVMGGLNWTVNMTKFNQTEQNLTDASGVTNYTYFINTSDRVGNWTIEVINATDSLYGANIGNGTFAFNVSRTLVPYFLPDLYTNRRYSLSQNVNTVTPVYVRVNYSRGTTTNYTMSVNLSYSGTNHTMTKTTNPTYSNSTMTITTPGTNDASFTLYAYVSDSYNNTGSNSITMKTQTSGSGGDDTPPGGGPSGGTPPAGDTEPSCNCTTWEDAGCGIGGCGITAMYQTRVCTPSGCDNESQCIPHTECILERDFNMTSSIESITMKSGENATAIITFTNSGEANITLEVNASMERQSCSLFPTHRVVDLVTQASVDVPFVIHSSLLQDPGYDVMTVTAAWNWLEKSKSVNVRITDNPIFGELETLTQELAELESRVLEYAVAGVWTAELEASVEEMKQAIKDAETSIARDDIRTMRSSIDSAASTAAQVKGSMTGLEIQELILDLKWWIIIGIIVVIIDAYIIMEIALPLNRLGKDIKKLAVLEKEMVKKRKEIEKQYFMGKINEKAFNDMLIGGQEKLLGVRGEAAEKAEEKKKLMKEKLSARGVLNWLTGGPRALRRKLKGPGKQDKPPVKQ